MIAEGRSNRKSDRPDERGILLTAVKNKQYLTAKPPGQTTRPDRRNRFFTPIKPLQTGRERHLGKSRP